MHAQFRKIVTTALLTAGLLASGAATAQANIDDRQAHQQRLIHKGVRDGALTRHEADRLIGEQKEIATIERRFRRSGDRFTRRERRRVNHLLDRSARHIRKALHNDQTR